MKAKLFGIVLALFVLVNVASAQGYFIRVANNTNLRAAASLQARIVETAPAGAILNVVGSYNRWLRVNRNGNDAWMADWVDYTRVEESAPTQPQTASNIDNCCFVDRQCHSNQEWTDGYWAFQNGQCAAPAQSQPGTSAQPASNAPANADNCCFIGWQCQSDEEWAGGFHAFQENRCKHPGIALQGAPGFILQYEGALDMLKSRVPHWYDYTVRGLDRIIQMPPGYRGGVNVRNRTWRLDYPSEPPPVSIYGENHVFVHVGGLAHEACHVHRHEAGLEAGGFPGESACLELQIQVLEEVRAPSELIGGYRHTFINIENPEYWWWVD